MTGIDGGIYGGREVCGGGGRENGREKVVVVVVVYNQ